MSALTILTGFLPFGAKQRPEGPENGKSGRNRVETAF